MKLKKALFLVCLFVISHTIISQNEIPKLTTKDSTSVNYWLVGIGYNFVDDSGDVFDNLFDVNSTWNAVPYPSRISIGKYFKNGIGVEAIGAYNHYNKGKRIDKQNIDETSNFLSIDARLSYDLNKIFGDTGWFDPYVGLGLGFSDTRGFQRGTYNAVLGFRTWFSDRIGLDINSTGKWAMNFSPETTNYKQYAVGIVYKFNAKKELTKKGEEKLALINELEKEKIRVNDSLVMVAEVKEKDRQLEEQLAHEKEANRLTQIEKEKQLIQEKELADIQKSIDALGKINFHFNSSNLDGASKKILLELISILNNYPDLVVKISSHTDSRGSASYNQKLSEERLKSTIKFLLENNVLENKVTGKAYGEEKLLNECDDNTKCTEAKHKENRRSEIKTVDFKY